MCAVLGLCNCPGNETCVLAIFPTEEEARAWVSQYPWPAGYCRYAEFEFGDVDFIWDEAKE